jgi:hypothetical protein
MVKVFHPPQKFERPPFWNGLSYGIKVWHLGHLQWHHFTTKFHDNHQVGLKVIRETCRQPGDLTSQYPFLNEYRLKTEV